MIQISTDYVFSGEGERPWEPDDACDPQSVYGQTKYEGEQAVQEILDKYFIVRIAWVFGVNGKNFVKTMLNLTATKPQLKVVFDQVGTPTYAYDLALAIYEIINERKYEGNGGIYHYSNEGVCSWFDFAKIIAEYAGNTNCDILSCHSDEFPSPVKRPSYSVLDKTKIKATFGVKVPYWTDSLKVCLENLKK
jgi:dTDP-4-dehydrorhamnose reductase